MSYPVNTPDGTFHISLTERAEQELERLAEEHPEATIEELLDLLGKLDQTKQL